MILNGYLKITSDENQFLKCLNNLVLTCKIKKSRIKVNRYHIKKISNLGGLNNCSLKINVLGVFIMLKKYCHYFLFELMLNVPVNNISIKWGLFLS